MAMTQQYSTPEPARAEIDQLRAPTVIEFGNAWCGRCMAAQPLIEAAFAGHEAVQHIKVADGPGRRLGRSFGVKLWPTLVFMRDGQEVAKLVRPGDEAAIRRALAEIDPVAGNR